MEFEIDFGTTITGPASEAASQDEPLYASVDGMVAPLSGEECAFQVRGDDAVHVMTLDVLKALDLMQRYEPLSAHYARIEAAQPALAGKREAIEKVVGFLVDRGLVVGAEDLLPAAEEPGPAADGATIPLVIVRTCDRPEALARLVESLACRGEGARPEQLVVVDDSREEASVAANRDALEAWPGPVAHLDGAWRQRFVAHLAGALAPGVGGAVAAARRRAIEELLLPAGDERFSGGAALNVGLLLAAGGPAVILDDDMAWEPRLAAAAVPERVSVAPAAETPLAFLDDAAAGEGGDTDAPPTLAAAPGDWLGRATAAAGAPLVEAAARIGATVDASTLARQDRRAAQRLLRDAHVRTIQFGYYGDSCMDTRLWLYLAPTDQARHWWGDRGHYFDQLQRPRLRQGYGRPQVSEIANFTPAVIDARTLVPPAAPRDRGEDLVLTAFLRFIDPRGVNLNLPVLLSHERPGERPPENPDAFLPWATRFFAEYALAHLDECEAASPEARLAHLARRFADLVDADGERLQALLREFLGFMRARVIQRLQGRLSEAADAPEHFRTDLTRWIEANGRALTERRPPRLRGWSDSLDGPGCAEALRRDAGAFARWLTVWPRLWEACRGQRDTLLAL